MGIVFKVSHLLWSGTPECHIMPHSSYSYNNRLKKLNCPACSRLMCVWLFSRNYNASTVKRGSLSAGRNNKRDPCKLLCLGSCRNTTRVCTIGDISLVPSFQEAAQHNYRALTLFILLYDRGQPRDVHLLRCLFAAIQISAAHCLRPASAGTTSHKKCNEATGAWRDKITMSGKLNITAGEESNQNFAVGKEQRHSQSGLRDSTTIYSSYLLVSTNRGVYLSKEENLHVEREKGCCWAPDLCRGLVGFLTHILTSAVGLRAFWQPR